jgi:Domain of unknown function (DUF4276)
VSAQIFLEGGGDSKDLHRQCREGFRKLLERCGFKGRMPELKACGGRTAAFRDFKIQQGRASAGTFIGLLVDSEDPVDDPEKPWRHLESRERSPVRPAGAADEQAFLMTTSMETWIVCDLATLQQHYGSKLQVSALPAPSNLEQRERGKVQKALEHATRNCSNAYAKGQRSFDVLGKLDPDTLAEHLPSFARMRRILNAKLGS